MRNRTEDKIRVVFIRHGRTAANNERRYIGKTDEGLTYDGADELLSVRDNAEEPDEVFSSPMKRCLQTVRVIFGNIKPVIINDWTEMDFGSFEYKNYEELKDDPDYRHWVDEGCTGYVPNGESRSTFIKRTMRGFKDFVRECQNRQIKKAAAVVHGGTIMAILSGLTGRDYFDFMCECGHGYRTELEIKDDVAVITDAGIIPF
ncbi:MAG: histidine phosphatase family protein [Candidatus Alectryocaccobium sp.]|jgi:alpha-ribazole phosphatase|nr:histidine phosphatase family protein [Lachnospiraceae bacterium]MDY6222050.1 histidine phosphatase family protein [Candidatus Alectryocaccobium sp.]